jgi:hypothetical protein
MDPALDTPDLPPRTDGGFKLLRRLELPEHAGALAHLGYVDERCTELFPGDALHERFARALAARRAVPFKELCESFEFFARVRRPLYRTGRNAPRAPVLADLCSGHGLVGALFALYERSIERVLLIDERPPPSRAKVLDAAREVAPWTADKLELADGRLKDVGARLPHGAAIVAVHACGALTDEAIALGLALEGPIAVMPCCRPHGRSPAPPGLARALGDDVAFDVDRTYTMERAGWSVAWDTIPAAITPMNRILVGRPPRG